MHLVRSDRAWDNLLEQMRRDGEAGYLGLRLEPCGRVEREGYPHPVYLLQDVGEFIRRARELNGGNPHPIGFETFKIEFDRTLHCPWQARTIKPAVH